MRTSSSRIALTCLMAGLCVILISGASVAVPYLDNETIYPNQDPNTETRRSDHFRVCFGHYNRDSSMGGMSEAMAQGNLQMFENLWTRNIVELGLNDMGQSAILEKRDGNFYRTNFLFLMTWDDGGGGGAWMGMDGNGYSYAMANPGYCRWDPPSGATPHELGHCWEGQARGFNGTDSSGAWWECTANWFQLQLLNSYPGPGGLLANSMYYCTHGRDYYDSWIIWEAAREDPRYGPAYVNQVWTDATPDQQAHEFIIERMARVDSSGSADKAGANRDLWGDMAKKCVTWDYERQQWFASANSAEDGSDWGWYQRCRTPLVKMPGATGWYRPERSHIPMEYGFNIIPLTASPNTTVTCNFQPQCDPVRQSDWRTCLVAVSNNNDARYSSLWNKGANSITLSADESKLYLVVIATPKPINAWAWDAYRNDAGLQFPYALSFTNATPRNVIYPVYTGTHTHHANGGGLIQSGAVVAATAYVGPNAQVLNTAHVNGYARIEDYAVVRDNAVVEGNAVVSGHAVLQDTAHVYGNAKVRDWARVFGNAQVYDNAKVIEHANVGDNGNVIHGSAICKGTTYLYSPSDLLGCIITDGDTANGNGTTLADHGVHFGWQWGQNQSIFTNLTDNGYIYARHTFERENAAIAWDEYGINQGFLMNGCRAAKDTVAPTRGGRVLPLNSTDQYVELHNSVNDFRETAITVWVKWTGSAPDQRIWSMGDGASKYMYLTPADDNTGKLRFTITNGTTTQALDGAAAIPANVWTHVAITFGSPVFNTTTKTWSATGTLYVNGSQVATLAGMIVPDSLNAPLMENANYLGRGNAGNYLQGYLDDFRVYMKALTSSDILAIYNTAAPAPVTITPDTTAPTPNAETWLVNPTAISDNAITMSATQGTDASGWVEYYFQNTTVTGHDSGWVSFNKYTDVGLTPGTAYIYTVKMRDKNGNTTGASADMSATTQTSTTPTASFAYGPVGIANGQVTMTATKVTSPSGLVEYKFNRITPWAASSGWQASPTWTTTGLNTGVSCSCTVTVRDGRGNMSAASAPVATMAKDLAAPRLPISVAEWQMQPYATIDNKVCMTTQSVQESGAKVYYQCVSGGGPDSGWVDATTTDDHGKSYYAKWTTPNALADGTYRYQYKLMDAAGNQSPYSTTQYSATITPTTGYHSATISQLATLPDDNLVTFPGTVMRVNTNNYYVKDLASGASITVKPNAGKSDGSNNEATDPALALKNVSIQGHLYTLGGSRVVTYATVTPTGNPTTYTISGKVSTTGGVGIANATVYFSDIANPSVNPIVTATTNTSGNYSRAVTSGTWYVAAGASAYNTSADQIVTVTTSNVGGINFTLIANASISGKVTKRSDGTAIVGASVYFSKSPGAAGSPTFTTTTDASGNYTQTVQDGTWYVAAGGTNYYTSMDTTVVVSGSNVTGINFSLKSNTRNIPRQADLLFSVNTDSLPASGATGNWPTYIPSGSTLTSIGSPTVDVLNGIKWEHNNRMTSNDGFRFGGEYTSPITVDGVTIVAAVKPTYCNPGGEARGEIVDIFYGDLFLAVGHTDGQVIVCRRDYAQYGTGYYVPNGQKTILSLVVSATGDITLFANGVQKWSQASGVDYTKLQPGAQSFKHYIDVGRNDPDGWSAFNGNIGDVFVYKVALSDTERQTLETDLYNKFLTFDITASAGANGSVTPAGVTTVDYGSSQTYTITPNPGYAVANVTVDGVSQGAVGSYAFTNVMANHTISATFIKAAANIAEIKAQPADTLVRLTGAGTVIYAPKNTGGARTTTFFYIGEAKGLGGLKVLDKTSDTLTLGNQVSNLIGYVRKPAGAEPYLELTSDPTGSGNSPIPPIGMNNKAALTDAKAPTNAVVMWGKVTSVNGTTSFTIKDGYGITITVNVNGVALPSGFDITKTAIVTGVLSKDLKIQAQTIRAVP